MDQKIAFVTKVESGQHYFADLCAEYGISRKTGYKLINRYRKLGTEGLHDRSSRPRYLANAIDEAMVQAILKWRKPTKRGTLGARKIRTQLLKEFAADRVPSSTTVHNVLLRQGLVKQRKNRRRIFDTNPANNPTACNEIWTADYKGHFALGNGRRCHPLTVCDSFGRFILAIKGQYRETRANVQEILGRLFREYGQPAYLLTDNGSCFASMQSPCGYGSLSYWLIDHGIQPVFSDPGRPGQNGRHERMHRDLKEYCCRPRCFNLSSQNRLMNEFHHFYNYQRPHAELDDRYPGDVYQCSPVQWQQKVAPPQYDTDLDVRRVASNGAIRWGSTEWVMRPFQKVCHDKNQ